MARGRRGPASGGDDLDEYAGLFSGGVSQTPVRDQPLFDSPPDPYDVTPSQPVSPSPSMLLDDEPPPRSPRSWGRPRKKDTDSVSPSRSSAEDEDIFDVGGAASSTPAVTAAPPAGSDDDIGTRVSPPPRKLFRGRGGSHGSDPVASLDADTVSPSATPADGDGDFGRDILSQGDGSLDNRAPAYLRPVIIAVGIILVVALVVWLFSSVVFGGSSESSSSTITEPTSEAVTAPVNVSTVVVTETATADPAALSPEVKDFCDRGVGAANTASDALNSWSSAASGSPEETQAQQQMAAWFQTAAETFASLNGNAGAANSLSESLSTDYTTLAGLAGQSPYSAEFNAGVSTLTQHIQQLRTTCGL